MRLLFNLTAVEEADNTVGLFCLLLVVCYHDNSATVLAVELVEEVHYLGAHFRVEVTGRFVGKYYLGIACNGTGDGVNRFRHFPAFLIRRVNRIFRVRSI